MRTLDDSRRKKLRGSLGKDRRDGEALLTKEQHQRYRAVVARANYLVPDRLDIAYWVKELAMAAPTQEDWSRLVVLARYLKD